MAADFIKIDRTTVTATHAQLLLQTVSAVRQARTKLEEVQGIGFRNFDGSDFTAFAALFGVPGASAQTVFDLINGTIGALNGTLTNANSVELINRVG